MTSFEEAALEVLKRNQPRLGDVDLLFGGSGSRAAEAELVANILAHAGVGKSKQPFFSRVSLLVPPGAADDQSVAAPRSRGDVTTAPLDCVYLKSASWPLVLARLSTMSAATAVVVACSELPRSPNSAGATHTPTGAQTPFGEVWRVGALEDEWINHLVDFAQQAKKIAAEKDLYLLLHIGQPYPSAERHRVRLNDACDSLAQIGSKIALAAVPPDALVEWVRRARAGEADAVLAEIAADIGGRMSVALSQVQVLLACGLDSRALSLAESLGDDVDALGESTADTLLARVWLNNGHSEKCRGLIETALTRPYLDELSLRTLHVLALRLEDDALQERIEGLLFERYPDSRFSIARRAYRLMADGDYASAAQATAISGGADLVRYLHVVCTLLSTSPTSLTAAVEEIARNLPEFRSHAIADCLAYATRSGALVVAAEFLATLIENEDALHKHARDASLLLRLLLQQGRSTSDDNDDQVEAALQCVAFLVAHLALDPSSPVRGSLANTLSPEGSGYLGQLVVVRAVTNLQGTNVEIEERSYPTTASAEEFIAVLEKYVRQRASNGKVRLLVGQALDETVAAAGRAPALLVAALRQLEYSANHVDADGGERTFDLMLFLALDLASTCGDEQAAGIALSLGATALAATGLSQRARDLTEHGLLLAKGRGAERRHRAWVTFADVYCRCKNPIEGAIGWLAAARLSPKRSSSDDAFNEATVLIRLLRDLHEPAAALEALAAARHLEQSSVRRLRLDHLEGILLLVEASTAEPATAQAMVQRLLKVIGERLMPALNEGDAPVVLLASETLLLAKRIGYTSGSEFTALESALLASPTTSTMSMLARDDASIDSTLGQLLRQAALATSSDDRARDAYNLSLFARRRLRRLVRNPEDLGDALLLLECCLSHSVSPVVQRRPRKDPLREHVLRKRLEEQLEGPTLEPAELPTAPSTLGTLIEAPGILTEIERDLSTVEGRTVDIEYLLFDEEQQLLRAVVCEGKLAFSQLDAGIQATSMRQWLADFPHGLEALRGPGALNQFEEALATLRPNRGSSDRLTIFVCDALIARVPHHLFKLGPTTFRVQAPCAVVPSLSWLGSSMRLPPRRNGRVCAWILPPDQHATISAIIILKEALEQLAASTDLVLATGSTLPSSLQPLDLVVVVAHGGLGVAERFFVTAAGEDGTQHTSWGFVANLAGSRVVVLLVCSGGRVDVDPFSDRLVGLHVELLDRGVRTVVASPWKLQSTSAADWIRHFLEGWYAGKMVAECAFRANEAIAVAGEPADYLAMHVYGDPFQANSKGQADPTSDVVPIG